MTTPDISSYKGQGDSGLNFLRSSKSFSLSTDEKFGYETGGRLRDWTYV